MATFSGLSSHYDKRFLGNLALNTQEQLINSPEWHLQACSTPAYASSAPITWCYIRFLIAEAVQTPDG